MWQNRSDTQAAALEGGSSMFANGALHFPTAALFFSGGASGNGTKRRLCLIGLHPRETAISPPQPRPLKYRHIIRWIVLDSAAGADLFPPLPAAVLNAVWLALWRPAHGELDASAVHRMPRTKCGWSRGAWPTRHEMRARTLQDARIDRQPYPK